MPFGHAVVAVAVATTSISPPPEGPAPSSSPPPGGYWGLNEKRDPEPKDGRFNLTIGAILLPLGILRAGAGGINVYTTTGSRCADIYGFDADSCASFRAYGWWGVGFGGLMAVTGAVFLGIGLKQKSEHDAWRRRYGIAVSPASFRRGAGGVFVLRF